MIKKKAASRIRLPLKLYFSLIISCFYVENGKHLLVFLDFGKIIS